MKLLRRSLILCILFLLMFTSFGHNTDAGKRTSQLIEEWERAKLYTQDYLTSATEDLLLFKPMPEMRSFAQQMLHLADDNNGFASLASGKQVPTDFGELEKAADKYKVKAALSQVVLASYDFVISTLKELPDDKLNEIIPVFRWKATREMTYFKAFEHQTHHRGQTTVYLRLKGIKPPEERLF